MKKFFSAAFFIFLTAATAPAQSANTVSISSDGWTASADGAQGTLTINHDQLGTLIKDARLNLQGNRGLQTFKSWSAEKLGENRLSIKTTHPPTAWVITLSPNALEISATSAEAVVTARAPAPPDRIVARVLDPQGVPVSWMGTAEVKRTYGGLQTWNRSFLPPHNPECMYFALGQVSSANLHSLFDRKTDTVIEFSDQTLMRRNRQDRDLLDVTIAVPGNTLVRVLPDYYTKTLGVPYYLPFDDTYCSRPPMVWCSWDNYYAEVRETDIVRNADWIAKHLKPYGFDYVVLDDGYDRGKNGEHDWIGTWNQERFPHGPQWLTNHIKSQGLRAGVWLVPNAYAGAVEEHPDWYLRYKDGKIVRDYSTPALDPTNPQVLEFLKKLFTTLDDWGFDYYKFDGEHAIAKYAPGVDLDRLYDKNLDPLVAYRNRLKLIRETVGPQRFIEGCPAGTPLNGIGDFDSYFTGADMYTNWWGQYALFSSINGNAFLNHIVVYVMPGEGIEVGPIMSLEEAREKRARTVVEAAPRAHEDPRAAFGTTLAEARTLVSYVALTGVVYSLSSVMPELPEERVRLLKMALPTLPILPIDLFSRGTDAQYDPFEHLQTRMAFPGLTHAGTEAQDDRLNHTTTDDYIPNFPEILDLKVNAKSGVYDAVALTNWRSWPATRELSFAEKLGLDSDTSYVVFDFWNQKPLGVFKRRMDVPIEPHDTRVLFIHPLLNHPQLVGISRHISGAYSIEDLAWDPAKNALRGSSATVAGDPYTLWIYVPGGATVSQAHAATQGNREVTVKRELAGNSLELTFEGRPETVNWEVSFAAKPGK